MTTACPRAPRNEKKRGKKQQRDPRGEDKKESNVTTYNVQTTYE